MILVSIPFFSFSQMQSKGAVLSSGAIFSEGNSYKNISVLGQPIIQNEVYFDSYQFSIGYIFDWTSSITNIPLIQQNNSIEIFPNPTSSIINISAKQVNILGGKLRLINSLGQVILMKTIESNTISLDLGYIESGIYFLVIKNSKDKFIEKVIIE